MVNWFTQRQIIVLLSKCYSSNILYWVQVEMWEKHLVGSWELQSVLNLVRVISLLLYTVEK